MFVRLRTRTVSVFKRNGQILKRSQISKETQINASTNIASGTKGELCHFLDGRTDGRLVILRPILQHFSHVSTMGGR